LRRGGCGAGGAGDEQVGAGAVLGREAWLSAFLHRVFITHAHLCWYASNYSHVANGRAYIGSDGQVYAANSNQYLGYYLSTAYTDVRRTSAGYYAYGTCS
jgi:hypothetical protein